MSGSNDLEQRAQAMGAVAVFPKPINFDVLLDVVRRYCSGRGIELQSPADGFTNRRRQNGA